MSDTLNSGQSLTPGNSIISQNNRFTLILQGDGNLVLYGPKGEVRFATNTNSQNVGQAIMQGDGNFVMYGPGGEYIWDSATQDHPGAWLVIQNDGNLVIYDSSSTAIWASNSSINSRRTNFTPQQHGFHFGNNFVNNVATLPGGQQIETRGRCGGMAFASLDYYFAGLPIPAFGAADFPGSGVPPDGHWLADYIYSRLMESFISTSAIRFLSWTLQADHPTLVYKGVTGWTKEDEIPRLCQFIDNGTPVALGLIGARDIADVGNGNHQVVAYGYDSDPVTGSIDIYIYDNNNPDKEVVLSTDPGNTQVNASNHAPWRGFFVHEYNFKTPPYTVINDGDVVQSSSGIYIIFGGAKFHIPNMDELNALDIDHAKVRPVSEEALNSMRDIPQDGTLLKERSSAAIYVILGGQKCWIPNPDVLARYGGWDVVRVLFDGALQTIPDGPQAQ